MRTNGWFWAVVLSLSITSVVRADDEAKPESESAPKISSTDEMVNRDSSDCNDVACCCDPLPGCGWFAGTEFSFMHVNSRTGGTITASFSDTTAPGVATIAFLDHNGTENWGSAGRVWIGTHLDDCWDAQARYWHLGDNDPAHFPELNPAIPTVGTNFLTSEATDSTTATLIDIEGVRRWEWNDYKGDFFVGGRHAEFETDSQLLNFGVFTTGNFVNLLLQNGCSFDGNGVTYGGTLRHQLYGPHWVGFATLRGSTIYGHSDSFGRADGTVASSPSAPLVGAATVRRDGADARLYIYELETGAQYEYPLAQIPATFFFRASYELQNWDIDGKPTGGAGFGGTIGEITTNSFASAGLGGMILQGVTLGTGLTW
jgi:hypothetical protein